MAKCAVGFGRCHRGIINRCARREDSFEQGAQCCMTDDIVFGQKKQSKESSPFHVGHLFEPGCSIRLGNHAWVAHIQLPLAVLMICRESRVNCNFTSWLCLPAMQWWLAGSWRQQLS